MAIVPLPIIWSAAASDALPPTLLVLPPSVHTAAPSSRGRRIPLSRSAPGGEQPLSHAVPPLSADRGRSARSGSTAQSLLPRSLVRGALRALHSARPLRRHGTRRQRLPHAERRAPPDTLRERDR